MSEYKSIKKCIIGGRSAPFYRHYRENAEKALESLTNYYYSGGFDVDNIYRACLLADLLFNKLDFPSTETDDVKHIYQRLQPPRSSRIDVHRWLDQRRRPIMQMSRLFRSYDLRKPDFGFPVGPFTFKNNLNLSQDKVDDLSKACTNALKLCTNELSPGFTQTLYGDVIIGEDIGRKNWAAWYDPRTDSITMKTYDNKLNNYTKTFIHELGHRYYRKFLSSAKKKLWIAYDKKCRAVLRVSLKDWFGKNINLYYAREGRGGITIGRKDYFSNPKPCVIHSIDGRGVYIQLDDGSVEGTFRKKYLTKHIKEQLGGFPSSYALTNVEEHFCEALSYKSVGELHPKTLEAFDSIILNGVAYLPKGKDFKAIRSEFSIKDNAIKTNELPSKREQESLCESLAGRLGLGFDSKSEYGVFIYTNDSVKSTHAYMFIDFSTGNLFVPKSNSTPNLNVNIANITDNNLDICVGFERMSNLRPRWRTMYVITNPIQEAPETEISDQSPEPSVPSTHEDNLESIVKSATTLASSLDMNIKVGKKAIFILYQNQDQGTTHTYLIINKSNGYIHPPRHRQLPKDMSFGSLFEPNILSKVDTKAMDLFQPSWRTKFKHPKRKK